MCLVFDGLLQSIYFRIFCSKHSITFDTYLLSCRFYCVHIFYINFRSRETLTVTNSGAILLLIETLSNFRTIKVSVSQCKVSVIYPKVSVNSNVLYIQPSFPAFLIPLIIIKNIKNMHAVSTNQIAEILHFNDNNHYLYKYIEIINFLNA